MKKFSAILLALVVVLTLAACGNGGAGGSGAGGSGASGGNETGSSTGNGGGNSGASKGTVGLSMPTKSSERWVGDGQNMAKEFEALGYAADLQYGEDVIENQVSQIENMITKGVKILVIAAIDGGSLTDVLQKAHDQGIQVIAYDRLIMNSEYVDYYATFDNFKVGVQQAAYIEEKLGLKDGKGPFNIELFGGSPDDNNAYFFYDGAMSVLQPYIDSGKLVVRSGQTKMEQIATLRWDGATAQARMDNLLSAHYSTENVDAVLSPYDGISIGILSSLKGVGYGTGDKPLPIVTGQDAELASIKSILAGEQTQTVFKDTRELAKKAVAMAQSILEGTEAEVNDTETYDNGVKVVPSYLLEPVSVDKDNVEKTLVETGYYTKEELGL
ncbi:substrate-binding domain-containing protein [Paenibacillus macerans]|uniref:Substrate-binding domain-containing protein n=1 Tax=Paenibacillus macerans TaxID=44252 RepID=A0A6N8EYR0_PAEMA|nr:multiple monosaccharide ABC transporter substrate-binding protein [Paenibacillus macerans]MUG24815.1 substrate-binding domain-containing protein [Paenibacillus macerans]UMV49309.1 sugar-binding protein [Paenibacillus macerans]